MATLNFTVAYASTLLGLEGQVPSLTVYAEDLEKTNEYLKNK